MTTPTLGTLADRHDVTLEEHLIRDAEIPVLTGPQVQGDVIVLPTKPVKGQAVPADGVPVVRGENGGNTHLLVADGAVMWHGTDSPSGDLGVVHVPEGATAYLLHPEHGANGMGPGSYILRRQQEMADQIRVVAD
jgi:hypothetical protein